MSETFKAWVQLLTVITIIVVGILYGGPKYKRYLAVEAAKTEIDIGIMRAAANADREDMMGLRRIRTAKHRARQQIGLQERARRAVVVAERTGNRAKSREDRSRLRASAFAGATGQFLLSQAWPDELKEQLRHWREGGIDRENADGPEYHARARCPGLPALPPGIIRTDAEQAATREQCHPKLAGQQSLVFLSQAYNGHNGLQVADF